MQTVLILCAVYILVLPIMVRLFCHAQKKLIVNRAMERAPKTRSATENLPKPIWPVVKQRLQFTFRDTRPFTLKKDSQGGSLTNRHMFLILWAIGLALFAVAGFLSKWALLGVGVVFFITSVVFGVMKSKDVLKTREKIYARMFDIAQSKLGVSMEHKSNPTAVLQVTDWIDLVKPNAVQFDVPTTFGMEGQDGFLKQFNQVFGNETAWVPADDPENHTPGWDYDKGIVKLRAVPPLPQSAPWKAHYVDNPNVAWSFFPIGLGVENGIELEDPETGEVENVLGFDFSGEQLKIGKKNGVKVSQQITTSPMVFVGGGTGGGKSLSLDTPITVWVDDNDDAKAPSHDEA